MNSTDAPARDELLEHYQFDLPPHLIAQAPLPRRDDARLMMVERQTGTIDHAIVRDLPRLIQAGDLLVLNDTRVIPAKLVGFRAATRGRWQGLFLEADDQGIWRVLGKTRGKLQLGEKIILQDLSGQERLELVVLTRLSGGTWAVKPSEPQPAIEILEQVGRVPLPHYIRHGQMVEADRRDYQTVFATKPGSVAAPTAGLHFTKKLIEELIDVGVRITRITLHVGIGTFRPITVVQLRDHEMHAEWGTVDDRAVEAIAHCRQQGGRVIAVGTTTTRLLETWAQRGGQSAWTGHTELFIRPPFTFRAIDGLFTNFHLPRSTLLVLVRTFGGDELIQQAYREAIAREYRFFSYGDAMLIV